MLLQVMHGGSLAANTHAFLKQEWQCTPLELDQKVPMSL